MRSSTLMLMVVLGFACSTTRIVDSWRAPDLTPADLQFEHVAAIAITANASHRRIAEDAIASTAETTRVTPGYTLLDDGARADVEQVRRVLSAAGVDGAVVVRLVGSDQKQTWVPPQTRSYGGFYGYYGRVGPVVYDPGYVRTDTYVQIETSLHDVKGGKLLWSAISETINPSSLDALMKEIVEAAGRELRDQGLLP